VAIAAVAAWRLLPRQAVVMTDAAVIEDDLELELEPA
jgi:hypothetical protein